MDPLTAFRQAVMAGKGDEITYDKKDNPQESTITIDGVAYPAMAPTAFKQGKKQVTYPLLSIFFGWQYRDKASSEMIRAILTNKAVILLVTDKPTLIQYLQGLVEAADYIDQSLLRQGSVAAAAAEVGAAAETELPLSKIVENLFGNADNTELATTQLYSAIQAEIPQPGRDRRSVLQAPGRNFRDEVFSYFVDKKAQEQQAAAAAAAAAASKKRGRDDGKLSSSSSSAAALVAQPSADVNMKAHLTAHFRGTPVIIIPNAPTSLINMYNVAAFLQEDQFVPPAEARAKYGGAPKPTKVTIQRKDSRGNTCKYYIFDDVSHLQKREDWMKVAAVFAQGPAWQFTGWRWGREKDRPDLKPEEIFERAKGFHLMFEGDIKHENIDRWDVTVLPISKTKRWQDPGVAQKFWGVVDNWILVHRPWLLPKPIPGQG